jgi:UDP-N-acetylmuramoyl-tripeptide--D-alanyl-D-alanine ligase
MSRPLWTSSELAAVTGGRALGTWSAEGVSIDSRTVAAGELFVALRGPHHDGHDFVREGLERGARAVLDHLPEGMPGGAPLLLVDDTMTALGALGAAARARSRAKILAITGSVGKTGTKEALRLALAGQAPTHASSASHNNHWGVPLSLARQPLDAAFAIYELGMSSPGEIAPLARMVRPHVALITAVEAAHLGFFRSVAEIAEAKGEVFQGLEPGGIAVLNADSPHYARLRELAEAACCSRVVGFGEARGAKARLLEMRLDGAGSDLVMTLEGREIAFRIGAPGRHWVSNALAVVAAAFAFGADPWKVARALAGFSPPKGRGLRHELLWRGGRLALIDESYNANPASMRAALGLLGMAHGRRIAVLGDMLELGEEGPDLHAGLAEAVAAQGVDLVFTVGPLMRHLHDALPAARRGVHAPSSAALLPELFARLCPGDVVLVKGSLGSRMGPIVEALVAEGERAAAARGTELARG